MSGWKEFVAYVVVLGVILPVGIIVAGVGFAFVLAIVAKLLTGG